MPRSQGTNSARGCPEGRCRARVMYSGGVIEHTSTLAMIALQLRAFGVSKVPAV